MLGHAIEAGVLAARIFHVMVGDWSSDPGGWWVTGFWPRGWWGTL